MRRLTERLSRLEQRHQRLHYGITDAQLRRIAESIAIGELLHRSPTGLKPAERLNIAREALPRGLGDPDRVARQWLDGYRLGRRCGDRS